MKPRNFVNRIKSFLGGSFGASMWGWAVPGKWNKTDFLKQYTRYTHSIVSLIAENSAKIEFEMKQKNDKGVLLPNFSHPFLKLIRKPNPMFSQFQFLELHFTFMGLCGESFWYVAKGEKTGEPKELYLLRPDLIDVAIDDKDPRGLVAGYVLDLGSGKKQTFNPDEIIHFKLPNPLNPHRGLGVVEAAKIYIETEEYTSNWTKNSVYNSGRPSGIVNVRGTITKEEFEQLKKQYKNQYTGVENAGKTLFLKGAEGVDYQKLGMELGEVALKDLKDMVKDDLMFMYRISKTMMGIAEGVTVSNAKENKTVFIQNIIIPNLDRLCDHLQAFALPMFKNYDANKFTLGYENPTPIDVATRIDEWTKGHNKWLTTNAIIRERNKLFDDDVEEIDGGDILYQPITNVPVGSTPVSTPTKRYKKKIKNYLSQEIVFKYAEQFYAQQAAYEKEYQRQMQQEFDLQEKEILSKNKKAAFSDWLFDVDASQKRIQGTFVPLGIELMQAAAELALEIADDKETEFLINQQIQKYLQDRTQKFAVATNDETIMQIEATISEGIKQGESVSKLRNRIRTVYDATKSRAERIARTESLAVSNEGALEAYKQSPMVNAKEWSAEIDACEFCKALNGKVIGLNEHFLGFGQSMESGDNQMTANYESIVHPPLHPNCKCSLLPVH